MIELTNVSKSHYIDSGNITVPALNDISLKINPGEFVAIMGPSGSGKSTLLNLIGCLDTLDSGTYQFMGRSVSTFSDDQLAQIRLRHIGFVFQSFNLIQRLDAIRNVELPMVYANIPPAKRLQRAHQALNKVGLANRRHHTPSQLSGGQQQRVAIARSMVNNPKVIIADEPTGNLDENSSREIMEMFRNLHSSGKTIIYVTHEENVANYASRIVIVHDGHITKDFKRH